MTAAPFPLGDVVTTPTAFRALYEARTLPASLLARHVSWDWGEVPDDDAAENRVSVAHGYRVISSYGLETGRRVWIITEADRSRTTFLLPEQY